MLRRPLIRLVALSSLLAGPALAKEEPPPPDAADGPSDCHELAQRNERELAKWEKQQPATPYAYPREERVLNAPWGKFFSGIGATYPLLLATLLPHVGAAARSGAPALWLSWPWSVAFGPAYSATREHGSFDVQAFRGHRALLEPAVLTSDKGTAFTMRPGYRFLYHPTDWVVGVGGGVGTTADVRAKGEPFRFSVSPEAVLQFGHCCAPGYVNLTLRYDHYFAGTSRDVIGGSLGYTFF